MYIEQWQSKFSVREKGPNLKIVRQIVFRILQQSLRFPLK